MSEAPALDRFETVAYVYSPSDLALLLSLFAQAGIYVQQISDGHCRAQPGWTTALGGIALRVRAEDLEDAQAMLAAVEPVPHRGPLLTGIFPFDLFFFVVVGLMGMHPPPRPLPTFVLGEAVARTEA